MTFVKGMTKVSNSGRKPGVKNKRTLEFQQTCDDRGFVVADRLIDLFSSTKDKLLKFEILKEMAKYSYTIPKAGVDEKQPDDEINPLDKLRDVSSSDIKLAIAHVKSKESANE